MKLRLDLELLQLEQALAELLPLGLKPEALELRDGGLRLPVKAPMLGRVVLTAKTRSQAGCLEFFSFDLEGAGLTKSMVLSRLRRALADLDRRYPPFRVHGDADGDRLYCRW
ncbi:MAG: hypothetical protein DWQ01_03385 [Planctomycetota bacterium]|nr:MAG: hypothetical protein DWQ01_03385 [Planctomycetota bacterium]